MNRKDPANTAQPSVRLFGGLKVTFGGETLSLPGGKARSLFAALALNPLPQTRDRLADLLWPEANPARSRNLLSNALYRLKKTLGEDWINTAGETIGLNQDLETWVDVVSFAQHIEAGDFESLEYAASLYRGDLLPEIYEDWLLQKRLELQEQYISICFDLANQTEEKREFDNAFKYYHRLSHIDPLNEEAHQGLIRVYAQQGRLTAARKQYNRLTQLLSDELAVEPLPETQTLLTRINRELELTTEASPPVMPFVGRRQERARLLQLLTMAQAGQGGTALIEGDAGIGKTRFLENIAENASWRGMEVVWGRADQFGAPTPYAPLDQALQKAVPKAKVNSLQEALSPALLETLGGLIPRLRRGIRMQFVRPPDLSRAVLEGVRLLTKEVPLLLILEDIQWAGDAFWEVISFLESIEGLPLMVLLSYRREYSQSNQAFRNALQALDQQASPAHIRLTGLTEANLAGIAVALGHNLSQGELKTLFQTTGGSPLHFQEALLVVGEPAQRGLSLLLQDRLATLSSEAHVALELAAVLGNEVSLGTWQAVGGDSIPLAVPELIENRFIVETTGDYRFQHALTRQQVYEAIPPDRLKSLHGQIGAELKVIGAAAEVLGRHFEKAEVWSEAIHYYRLAGEKATEAYAFDTAVDHYRKALSLCTHLDDGQYEYTEILSIKQRLLGITGHLREWRTTVAELEKLADETDNTEALLAALEAKLTFQVMDSDTSGFLDTASLGIQLAQQTYQPLPEARIRRILGQRQRSFLGKPKEALKTLSYAAELAESAGDIHLLALILCDLAQIQAFLGLTSEATTTSSRALSLTQLRPELYPSRPYALQAHALVAESQADWQIAWSTTLAVIDMVMEINDRWALAEAEFGLASIGLSIGQYPTAAHHLRRLRQRAVDDGIPADSILIKRISALGAYAELCAGDPQAALSIIEDYADWADTIADSRPKLHTLSVLGQIFIALGRPEEAVQVLEAAIDIWESYGSPVEIDVFLHHAHAAHACDNLILAKASLARAQHLFNTYRPQVFETHYHFLQFRLLGKQSHLKEAHKAVQRQAARLEEKTLRKAFFEDVEINREVLKHWREVQRAQGFLVKLAKEDVPLGKPLRPADLILVHWTVDAGNSDAEVLKKGGKAALRRHRIQRLVEEAATQGAEPTDTDLAAALGVSRRTILRDIQVLESQGIAIKTRRRK